MPEGFGRQPAIRRRGGVDLGATGWLALLVLGLLAVDGFRRTLSAWEPARREWGPKAESGLSPSTRDLLGSLEGPIECTYFVTSTEGLPSHLRSLPERVAALLAAMERALPQRLSWRIVHPERLDGDDARHFVSTGVQTFGERTIQGDRWTSVRIHSSLEVAWGGEPRVRVDGIASAQVAVLETLLAEHIEAALSPRAPVVGVAGRGIDALEEVLAEDHEVLRLDLAKDPELPESLDLLWWVDPMGLEARHGTQLRRFLDRGGSVVLAASRSDTELREGRVHGVERTPGLEDLAREFGIAPLPGVVLDTHPESGALGPVDCIAPNQDFRGFSGQPNGTLDLGVPDAWTSDPARLADLGYRVEVLANASRGAQRILLPGGDVPRVDSVPLTTGIPTPRAALAMHLIPEDPWRGELVFVGSPTPFLEEGLRREDRAHLALVRVLQRRLASTARLVARRADLDRPVPLPDLAAPERIAWRAWVLGFPLLLGLAFWIRARRGDPSPSNPGRSALRFLGRGLLPLALVLLLILLGGVVGFLPGPRWQLDLSAGKSNSLAPVTHDLAGAPGKPVEVEICTSSPLPVAWRRGWSEIEGRLEQLRSAGLDLSLGHPDANAADPDSREALARRGVHPLRLNERGERSQTVREVYSSLRLRRGERELVLDFPAPRFFEALELRLALALRELNGMPRPRVGFIGDAPRLSPAEAHIEYQSRGLFAPAGQDAFRLAREWVAGHGFEVLPLAPEEAWPTDLDALIWMQPRRDVEAPLRQLLEHLGRGGGALICAQHFEMQARFARDDSTRAVVWPRPLYPDLEAGSLAELGLTLPRELLFDDASVSLRRTRRSESPSREGSSGSEAEATSRPDQMRVLGRGPVGSPGRALGELVFETPSWIELDRARLGERGLQASVWLSTGPDAWSRPWGGGELADAQLRPDAEGVRPRPSAPLAVDVRGPFEPGSTTPDGRLLLVGASSPFTNSALFDGAPGHAQLLVDAAARMTLGDEFAAISARRSSATPLPELGATPRLLARIGALVLGPLGVILLGLLLRRTSGVRG